MYLEHVVLHCVSSVVVFVQVWLTLADQYLHSISIDWDKTLRFAFNERSNPDDDSLGIQIVKVTTLYFRVGVENNVYAQYTCKEGSLREQVGPCVLSQQHSAQSEASAFSITCSLK